MLRPALAVWQSPTLGGIAAFGGQPWHPCVLVQEIDMHQMCFPVRLNLDVLCLID